MYLCTISDMIIRFMCITNMNRTKRTLKAFEVIVAIVNEKILINSGCCNLYERRRNTADVVK